MNIIQQTFGERVLDKPPVIFRDADAGPLAKRVEAIQYVFDIERAVADLPKADEVPAGEAALARMDAHIDFPLEHFFIDGVYVRKIFLKAGTMVTGKIHKAENVSMLIQGHITMYQGGETWDIRAPWVSVCPGGIKRALIMHEDSIFVTVHQVSGSTLAEAEAEVITDTLENYLSHVGVEQ